jgi:hypothetical protein
MKQGFETLLVIDKNIVIGVMALSSAFEPKANLWDNSKKYFHCD